MDINTPMTPEMIALGREAKSIIEGDAMKQVFKTLKEAYITTWEASDVNAEGTQIPMVEASARRGMLWVKVKCLMDLQTELRSYAERAEFAESKR